MAYDEEVADRARAMLALRDSLTERKMFGGVAWMIGGNMACGVIGDEVIVRVAKEDFDRALAEPEAREFDFTGRPMRGFVCVAAAELSDEQLAAWIDSGADHAATLPPKSRK
jgi:TfoX N-terminal domain